MKRRLRFRQLIWIGSIIEQKLHDVSVPALVGGVERRSLPTDGKVHVRPTNDQNFRYFDISAFASDIERSDTVNFVDSGAFVQSRRHPTQVATFDQISEAACLGRYDEKREDPRSPYQPHASLRHRILPDAFSTFQQIA
jgi:hypothetical protein